MFEFDWNFVRYSAEFGVKLRKAANRRRRVQNLTVCLVCVLLIIDTGSARGNLRQLHAARFAPSSSAFDIDIYRERAHAVRHESAMPPIFDTHSRPVHRRMCYGASRVRASRVTMRGEGIVTPWTETMTWGDKKMKRKKREKGNIKHTVIPPSHRSRSPSLRWPDARFPSTLTRDGGVQHAVAKMARTQQKWARECEGAGVGARVGRNSRGRGEAVRDDRAAVVRRRVVVAGNRMRAMMVDAGIGAWRAIVRGELGAQIGNMGGCTVVRAIRDHGALSASECDCAPSRDVSTSRAEYDAGSVHGQRTNSLRPRVNFGKTFGGMRKEACERKRAEVHRISSKRPLACKGKTLPATSAVDPTHLIGSSAPLSSHILLTPPAMSSQHLYASNPRPLFRHFPPIPPYARERHLNMTLVDLRKSQVFGTRVRRCQSITMGRAPRCSPIRAAYERDDAGVRTDREGVLHGDAAYATPAEDYMRGVGRLRTDAVQADREDSRLVQVLCPLFIRRACARGWCAGGTRVDGRHAGSACHPNRRRRCCPRGSYVRESAPPSRAMLLGVGICARAAILRGDSCDVRAEMRVLPPQIRRSMQCGGGGTLSASSFGDVDNTVGRYRLGAEKRSGRGLVLGVPLPRLVRVARPAAVRIRAGRVCGMRKGGCSRVENGLWTCMRAGRGTACARDCATLLRGMEERVCGRAAARVKRGGHLRRRLVRAYLSTSMASGLALDVGRGGVDENAQQSALAVRKVLWWAVVQGSSTSWGIVVSLPDPPTCADLRMHRRRQLSSASGRRCGFWVTSSAVILEDASLGFGRYGKILRRGRFESDNIIAPFSNLLPRLAHARSSL
ncbi:hypothetical protein C8R44DRAFT_906245 [Mycena epipterygia]|nr:hypothetical protein C8R44DRAFT_906245 [Mycena epipterygia]